MKRLLNAAVALAVTFVAYQAYVLGVVPIIEPPLVISSKSYESATDQQWKEGAEAVRRYQKLLSHYVPAGHWCLQGKPKVFEYAPASVMLVLDDFVPLEGGRLKLTKCLLVAFPTPRVPGEAPPRDAVIVEAPDETLIQFDNPEANFDFTSGTIGNPIAAEFPGELLIRSDMQEPGPQDDLRITTRDLHFNQSLIWTRASVDLRVGPHRASGRVMEVRLLKDPHARDGSSDMPIAGVESLEIREQVRAIIDTEGIAPKRRDAPKRVVAVPRRDTRGRLIQTAAAAEASPGLLEITSGGPFRFDFTTFVASLQENVQAALPRPDGTTDRLGCRELRLHFGDKEGAATKINPADEPDLARRQGNRLSTLTPQRVEAVGSPVRLDSPSQGAAFSGTRLQAWIGDRKLRIEGSPAKLSHGLSEVQSPLLEYDAPSEDSGQTVGDFLAAGPGWLRIADPKGPGRSYEARWQALPNGEPAVSLQRDNRSQPVLSLVGRPQFAATGFGKLRADRVAVQLREVPADGKEGPAIEMSRDPQAKNGAVLVRRIDATGKVDFVGEQLQGQAESLVAFVRPIAAGEADPQGGPSLGRAVGFQSRDPSTPSGGPSDRRYRLKTKTIQVDVGLQGQRTTPLSLVCDGGVSLEEETRADRQQPLKIVGEQLRVDRLDRRDGARLTLSGAKRTAGTGAKDLDGLAEIQAQGLRVWVRDLHIDQAAGRAWTEGRGDARLALKSGGPDSTLGAVAPLGGEATLRWRGGMQFDGRRLSLSKEVLAETAGGWLNCETLSATLTSPIDFRGGGGLRGAKIDVNEVTCSGGITVDYRSTDDTGQRSHERARFRDSLTFNKQTGAISGRGPGSIRSVHLAGSGGPLAAASKQPTAGGDGLRYLRVDFRNAVDGNANSRAVRFLGDVRAVYGPVLAWEHQLPLQSPDGVPPDAVELSCNDLRVNEDPAANVRRGPNGKAPLGPIELKAISNVRIDATLGEEGGGLVAEAAAASYAQAADRFILEGDAQQLARLWARPDATKPFVPASARRLTHYIKLGRTKVEDLRGAEYQAGPGGVRQTAPRR